MSKQAVYDKVGLLGIDVDVLDLGEAIRYITTYAATPGRPAGYIIKPYVEFFDRASANAPLQDLLNNCELAVADGVAVLWAAHYLYAGPHTFRRFISTLCQIVVAPAKLAWPIPERAAGTNFTWRLLNAAAAAKLRVYLIGKPTLPEITTVAKIITHEVPGIVICGTTPGYDPDSRPGAVSATWLTDTTNRLASTNPDLILVGMGFPLQEEVCAQLSANLDHGLFIGEGGTFDYESFGGSRRKAPIVLQRIGLEWLWRLILEPHRLNRQLAIPRFIGRIWRSRR